VAKRKALGSVKKHLDCEVLSALFNALDYQGSSKSKIFI